MKIYPCAFCKRLLETEDNVKKHIRKVHRNIKCNNCGQPLNKCKDINGVGQAFVCKRKK